MREARSHPVERGFGSYGALRNAKGLEHFVRSKWSKKGGCNPFVFPCLRSLPPRPAVFPAVCSAGARARSRSGLWAGGCRVGAGTWSLSSDEPAASAELRSMLPFMLLRVIVELLSGAEASAAGAGARGTTPSPMLRQLS